MQTCKTNFALEFSFNQIILANLKVVSATFLQVCFVCLKESTCETRKMFIISLRKLYSFLR